MKYYDLTKSLPLKVEADFGDGYKIVTLNYPIATLGETTVKFSLKDNMLGVDITSPTPICSVKVTFDTPNYCDDAYVFGDAFERGYGNLYWEKFVEGRICMWYMAVSDKVDTNVYGVMTGCNAFAYWKPNKDAIVLELDLRNGSYPVQLGTRTLHAVDIVCTRNETNESPFKTMQRFCKITCPSPRLPDKPIYGSNSWYYIFRRVSQKSMTKDADLLAECTKGLKNRPYCVVDEGWHSLDMEAYSFCKKLPSDISKIKFPDMPKLVEYMKSKDLLPGIWIRPLLGSRAFPKSMRMNTLFALFGGIMLDPSVKETLQYVSDTVKKFTSMGFRLIKHDFSTHDIMGYFHNPDNYKNTVKSPRRFHDKTKTTAEIILNFYKTIREAAGDDAIIIGCNTVSHLSAGLFELERTGNDTSPKSWERTVKNGVNSLAFRLCQHKTFYLADADCVGYTKQIPWKKDRVWLNMLAVSGTPLFTSITPKFATEEIKEDLKKAYALASEAKEIAVPIDWFETKAPTVWRTEQSGKEYKFDLE